jgi:hypothetical protein
MGDHGGGEGGIRQDTSAEVLWLYAIAGFVRRDGDG